MRSESPPPVQVRFVSLYGPDIVSLTQSLIPFGRWSEQKIAADLPVVVSHPVEISQRVTLLKAYLAAGGWPPDFPTQAIETVRAIVEYVVPRVEVEIIQGVRLLTAAAIRDDGSRAIKERDHILSSFLASRMLAFARVLLSHQVLGESVLNWGTEFYEMAPVHSDRLIYGLSFLSREPYGWAGWTDADLWVGNRKCRLFAPICPHPEEIIEAETLPPEHVQGYIIPQLLCPRSTELLSFSSAIVRLTNPT